MTRLDRDTSGIVIFAKHRYAHALLDSQLKEHKINKTYTAILSGILHNNHYIIDLPIGRDSTSLIKRKVLFSEKAKRSDYLSTLIQRPCTSISNLMSNAGEYDDLLIVD